ncbi:MAG: hypothetical protein ACPHCX_02965 [Candidatus Puniceispirillaceae bacterium]|jgi:hypothetical protein
MLKRTSFIVAGASLAIMSCAIAGGDPDANANASGTNNTSSAQTTTSSGSAQAVDNSQGTSTATNMSTNSGSTSQNEASAEGRNEQGFEAVENDELVIDTNSLADRDGMGSIQVQWQISDDGDNWMVLPGAIQPRFVPRDAEVGKFLRVQISYVDGQGNPEMMISPMSQPVRNVNDKPMGRPELRGEAKEDSVLAIDSSRISDEDGLGALSYIWQRSSERTNWENFPDQFKDTIRLTQSDVGFSYRAVVSYIDGFGTRETLVTDASEVVANVDNPLEGKVVVRGQSIEGAELTANTSTLSDFDGISSMNLAWETSTDGRTWRELDYAQGTRNLNLVQELVGVRVRARVNVVDNFGVETVAYSDASDVVRNVNDKPAGNILIRRISK